MFYLLSVLREAIHIIIVTYASILMCTDTTRGKSHIFK